MLQLLQSNIEDMNFELWTLIANIFIVSCVFCKISIHYLSICSPYFNPKETVIHKHHTNKRGISLIDLNFIVHMLFLSVNQY